MKTVLPKDCFWYWHLIVKMWLVYVFTPSMIQSFSAEIIIIIANFLVLTANIV